MKKEFLSPLQIRDNAIILADRIYNDGFVPSIIYVSLRGGATFGNVISEYFKLISPIAHAPLYACVVAHSYNIFSSTEVNIDGWTYDPQFIRPNDTVMLIDDIFDSGKTINVITQQILEKGIQRSQLKIVVHDYKIRSFAKEVYDFVPDYYSRKITIDSPDQDNWIHYLSHELSGLTEEEIKQHYPQAIQQKILELVQTEKTK